MRMKQHAKLPRAPALARNIILGRVAFDKISAVEGIRLSPASERQFAEFDRLGLSAEERRRLLIEKHERKV